MLIHNHSSSGWVLKSCLCGLVLVSMIGCGLFGASVGSSYSPEQDFSTLNPRPSSSPTYIQTTLSEFEVITKTLETGAPPSTGIPSLTVAPMTTITPLACIPASEFQEFGLVKRVISGDTIQVDIEGKIYLVRYAGIKSPLVAPVIKEFGPPAATSNSKMVKDQVVGLARDGVDVDSNGSLLRYVVVYNQEVFANYELVRSGLAEVEQGSQDLECYRTFQLAQEAARTAMLGQWAYTPTRMPTITTRPTSSRTVTLTSTPTLTLTPTVTGTPPTPTPSLTPTITPSLTASPSRTATATFGAICDPNYEDVCIPPPPPYFTCADIPYRNFTTSFIDPHDFDKNFDLIGCGPGDF